MPSILVAGQTFMALLAALSSFSMAATPSPADAHHGIHTTLAPGNFYHCVGGSVTSNPDHYPNCQTDPIPIAILWDATGKCMALPPYHELVIHTGGKKTVVKWKIAGPSDYVFAPVTDGVVIDENSSGPRVNDVYTDKSHENPQIYKIGVKAIAAGSPNDSQHFLHAPNVVDPVNAGSTCIPVDPLITNTSN